MWYSWIAMFIALLVAIPVSWLTGFAKSGRDYDPDLIYPVADNCCACCGNTCIKCFRCGHDPDAYYEEVNIS